MRVDYIGNVIYVLGLPFSVFSETPFHEQLVLVPLCFHHVLVPTSVHFPMRMPLPFHHWLCLNVLLYSVVGSDYSQVRKWRPLLLFRYALHDLVNYHSILNTAPGTLSLNP